ncbi:MAG: diaminopimelate epimerase [Flavobacteriales bacterium]|nr:diaminopimelate epimerase [Flavobacteriales bacterium]
MNFSFSKYQGTGNDFIMIDGRENNYHFTAEEIAKLCHRRFGIGADGLIIIKNHPELDFEMDYYNADGSQSFCGNGSRCAQAFARELGMIRDRSDFIAIDGTHEGKKDGEWYATHMADVGADRIEQIGDDWLINTGSPHYIRFVEDLDNYDIYNEGKKIRYSDRFKADGVNVNFVEIHEEGISVRTYERGVEDETYSCGTGVTAAAIAYVQKDGLHLSEVPVYTKGGPLSIQMNRKSEDSFTDVWLKGPALKVFIADI